MDTWFELGIDSGTAYLFIDNIIELYVSIWVPVAVIALVVARKIYNYKKDQVKIEPLLGVGYKPKGKR